MKKIFLYEEIGPWLDLSDFQQLAEEEPVTVFVNSPGGDLSLGLSIFNLLSRVKDLTVCIDGIAAASLLAFLPNAKVKMNSNSFLFLHLPSAEMCGAKRADDLLRIAGELEKMGGSILDIYIKKAKCSREELEKMLEETFGKSIVSTTKKPTKKTKKEQHDTVKVEKPNKLNVLTLQYDGNKVIMIKDDKMTVIDSRLTKDTKDKVLLNLVDSIFKMCGE